MRECKAQRNLAAQVLAGEIWRRESKVKENDETLRREYSLRGDVKAKTTRETLREAKRRNAAFSLSLSTKPRAAAQRPSSPAACRHEYSQLQKHSWRQAVGCSALLCCCLTVATVGLTLCYLLELVK
jgi:hypothetical protein